jgi:hypothetical protein
MMSRQEVRMMKRAVRIGSHASADLASRTLASDLALQLLERSIRFGHGRLSVLRLAMAVRSGAVIADEHWTVCHSIANASRDSCTQALYLEAVQARPS